MVDWTRYTLSDFYSVQDNNYGQLLESFRKWREGMSAAGFNLYQRELQGTPSNRIIVRDEYNGGGLKQVVNFSSFNYLGLNQHPEVIAAASEALKRYGTGAAGSPMLSGTFQVHNAFVDQLSKFKQKESTLLYPSGYSANVGVLSALLRPNDIAFVDRLAHASIIDGLILSKATVRYFGHNNIEQLEYYLSNEAKNTRKLIVVEGVYSMDGDLSKLPDIVRLAKKYHCMTMIDEAHSTLVFGSNGRGVAEHFGVEDNIDISLATGSKAFGGLGGFVSGKKDLIEYITYYSRSRTFSTSLPPALVAGMSKALEVFQRDTIIKDRLWKNVCYMKEELKKYELNTGDTMSQIIPVMVNDDSKIYAIGRKLLDAGLFVQPVVYPAVKKNRSRFRLTVTACHTKEDINMAVSILAKTLKGV